ncbi:hypothetical protein [Aquimarina sp. SS2-1]|uniref:hypothetical protein n=1 Tax=Aquimarina besae TaxID=3342247 RepID=UPI003672401D
MKKLIAIIIAALSFYSCDYSDDRIKEEIEIDTYKLETLEDVQKVVASFERMKENFLNEATSYDGYICPEVCETVEIYEETVGTTSGSGDIIGDYFGSTSAGHTGASFYYVGDFSFEMDKYGDFEKVILSGKGFFKYILRKSYVSLSTDFIRRDNFFDELKISSEELNIEIASEEGIIRDKLEIEFLYKRAEEATIYTVDVEPTYNSELINSYYVKTSEGLIFEWED